MKEIDLESVAAACLGKLEGSGKITGVCTDTRKIEKGCLFIALKGENFDGHDFTLKAVENGAVAVMCSKDCECGNAAVVRVDDTQKGLLRLAKYYRSLFDIKVVGVTGSVGKTTTKEMMHCVLSSRFNTHKNYGNLNNQIGMPMSVFELDDSYDAAVFEMGMADFKEISNLSIVSAPDIAVLTNIGVSHIETLGSQENILKAKLEILDGMKEGTPVVINADDKFLANAVIENHPKYYYGIESNKCSIWADDIKNNDKGTAFTAITEKGEQRVQLPTVGIHNVYNALASIQVGLLLGIPMEVSAKALEKYEPTGMRQRVNTVNG
ncbi:MAG: UDP-N-acetylmuramoyl-tripeptide--D-alanyl-D-alanine ligase, partial [Clostridiales bacterium]|nr:UDP-N-acetylmuramoyl-tripeptide--D-alanyl-D-alanine ligase [Clostridiales bacterium]